MKKLWIALSIMFLTGAVAFAADDVISNQTRVQPPTGGNQTGIKGDLKDVHQDRADLHKDYQALKQDRTDLKTDKGAPFAQT